MLKMSGFQNVEGNFGVYGAGSCLGLGVGGLGLCLGELEKRARAHLQSCGIFVALNPQP